MRRMISRAIPYDVANIGLRSKGMSGFKKFLLRGNLIDLAIAVVVGAAFGAVVSALVKDLITPLLAAVVYYLVFLPVNALVERLSPKPPAPSPTKKCPECLSDIPEAARRCAFCTSVVAAA